MSASVNDVLEAVRLGLGPLGNESRAKHLAMHLRQVGIEFPVPIEEEDEIIHISVRQRDGRPVYVRIEMDTGRSWATALPSQEAAVNIAAQLLVAILSVEEAKDE